MLEVSLTRIVIFSFSGSPWTLVYLKNVSELGFNISIVLFIDYVLFFAYASTFWVFIVILLPFLCKIKFQNKESIIINAGHVTQRNHASKETILSDISLPLQRNLWIIAGKLLVLSEVKNFLTQNLVYNIVKSIYIYMQYNNFYIYTWHYGSNVQCVVNLCVMG